MTWTRSVVVTVITLTTSLLVACSTAPTTTADTGTPPPVDADHDGSPADLDCDDDDPALDFERNKEFTPFTALFNLTGQPAVSLPMHWTPSGLPVGVMLAGRPAGEAGLLSLAAQLEEAAPWADRHPAGW